MLLPLQCSVAPTQPHTCLHLLHHLLRTTHRPQAAAAATAAEKAKKEVDAGKREPEAPPDPVVKEDRIAIQRTIGRKQPVKYYITGGVGGQAGLRPPCGGLQCRLKCGGAQSTHVCPLYSLPACP